MKSLLTIGPVVLVTALAAFSGKAFSATDSGRDAFCSVPAAVAGDGRDDRVAIQNALKSKGCAFLPAGRYDIDSIPFTPPARRPYMMLQVTSAELYGAGSATVLAFRGSNGGQDWEGIQLTGVGSKLHDLSITTGAISNTNEQTHAVKLLGPVTGAEVTRVKFDHPIRTGEKSGDCIQLVGYHDGRRAIDDIKIHDNEFDHCDRSGVAVHGGTTDLEIFDNRFEDIGNTDLDFEGTGDTSDVLIRNNSFTMSPGIHGVGAIQLQLIEGVRVTDNVFNGRGIDVYQSDDVEIDHNTMTFTQGTTSSVIFVHKDSARTRIHDNTITRVATAGAGAIVSAGLHGTGTPDHLEIDDNTLVQRTDFHVVSTSGLIGMYVRNNKITYTGALANVMWGVRAIGSAGEFGTRTTDVRVEANTFTGPLRGAVATSGSQFGVATVTTSDNVATGPTFGIYCDNFATQGRVLGPITSRHDSWRAPLCGPAGFVAVTDPVAPPVPSEDPPVGEDLPPVIDVEDPPVVDEEETPVPDREVQEREKPPLPSDDGTPPVGGGTPPLPQGAPPVARPSGPPSLVDTTAPVLSGVWFSRQPVRGAKAAGKLRPATMVLRLSSSEAATLSIRIERVKKGKKARATTSTRAIKLGAVSVKLKRLKPGSYRVTLIARDAAGNRSKATRQSFTVRAG